MLRCRLHFSPPCLGPVFLSALSLFAACCTKAGFIEGTLQPLVQAGYPDAVLSVAGLRPDQKVIVLTIDDSPSDATGKILDALEKADAKATFFIHGENITPEKEDLIKRMLREGHEVGNHMFTPTPSVLLTEGDFKKQFEANHQRLVELGSKPVRFRPANAVYNRGMKDDLQKGKGRELGYEPKFYWGSVPPWDLVINAPEKYAENLTSDLSPGRIVVFHDSPKQSERTLRAFPEFFKRLKDQGYRAVSVEEAERMADQNRKGGPSGAN